MDEMVLKAQRWVNATYGSVAGYNRCPEDGRTGWSTMYSLTRGLQIELGMTTLSDAFGPTTTSLLNAYGVVGLVSTNLRMRTIAEAALYCKGYSGGGLDGSFNVNTQAGLTSMMRNMGLEEPSPPGNVPPKVFKAMLTMDAYVLVNKGKASIQAAQQYLNGAYYNRSQFAIGPCDGHFSRSVQKSLVYAIQYQLGMSDSAVTGTVGPGTRSGLASTALLEVGAQDVGPTGFVRLFQTALIFNGYRGLTGEGAGTYTDATAFTTQAFQEFCHLEAHGAGDYATWMSLLVSTGDPDRKGTAFDCMYPLTQAKIDTVKAAGYRIVGRYLTGGTNKVLSNSEIALIQDNGLSFFPIYQQVNNALQYFSYDQGYTAGTQACAAASGFGLPWGTVIYFAVDFDAQDSEITSAVIPHFEGVRAAVAGDGNRYAMGVYGCRNTCLRLAAAGLTSRSFVSGMSTGYSGNLGYPLPDNWAFDQIKNLTLGSGAGAIEIDNDIASGRDPGLDSVSRPRDPNDGFYTYLIWLEARARQWREQGHPDRPVAELVAQFLRSGSGKFDFPYADEVFGALDTDFINYVRTYPGRPDVSPLRDPLRLWDSDLAHFGASFGAAFTYGRPTEATAVGLGDFGTWGGDLLSVLGQFTTSGLPTGQAYAFGYDRIASTADDTFLSLNDLIADVDATNYGFQCRTTPTSLLSDLIKVDYASPQQALYRYQSFYTSRFNSSSSVLLEAATNIVYQLSDVRLAGIRDGFWIKDFRSAAYPLPESVEPSVVHAVGQAFADRLAEIAR